MSTSYQIFLLSGADRFALMDSRLPAGPRVGDPVITEDRNAAPVLSFTITRDHPLFDSLTLRTTWLEVRETGAATVERYRVEPVDGDGPDGVLTVKAYGAMACLNDTVQPHWEHSGSPIELIDTILANHNAQAKLPDGSPDPMRQILRGVVSADLDPNNLVTRRVDAWPYPSSMEILLRSTCDSAAGGFVRVRTGTDGRNYLDWLSTGALSEQVVRFGGTLRQWRRSMDASQVISACEPIGAQLEDEDGNPIDGQRLLLGPSDGADLLYTDSDGVKHYGVINQAARARYGLVVGSRTWDDVTTPTMLKARAAEHAATGSLTQIRLDASMVDQHLIDPSVAQVGLCDRVRVVVPAIKLDSVMAVSRRVRRLASADWSVELGERRATLVESVAKGVRAADQVIDLVVSNVRLGETVQAAQATADTALATARDAVDAAADVAVTVETLQSTITQTEEKIRADVGATFVTKTALTQTTQSLSTSLTQTAEAIDVKISQSNERVAQINGAVVAEAAARETLIRLGASGVEVGKADSPTKTVLGNNGLSIQVNGLEVAQYTSTLATISNMKVSQSLEIGNRRIEPNPAGGMWIRKA